MDMKDADRVVIAKPVASRPTCSNFQSFSELLAGAINASPPNACSQTAITAIRPKTVRFKPTISRPPVLAVTSQVNEAEHPGAAGCSSSDKVVVSDNKPNVVYKPQAKLVSRRTVSLLANMGNPSNGQQQHPSSAETCIRHTNQERNMAIIPLHPTSNLHHSTMPSQSEAERSTEVLKLTSQNSEDDPKPLAFAADRPSYDGYNWRKYGQKQVKGSEYPRSYYKCTHPNCPVKKKVERLLDGQIAEIVYKGEHNHSKPQPPKRNSAGAQGSGLVSDGTGIIADRNEGSEVRIGNQIDTGLHTHSTYQCSLPPVPRNPSGTGLIIASVAGTPDNSCGISGEHDEGSKGLEGDDEEPRSKRRKKENQAKEAGASTEALQDARVVVQSATDTEITGDGFRWRKYGQKVVKGNPYPRSYYRCTSLKCNVRKHVERASDDPRAFITTYEGKHNHDMPLRTSSVAAVSEPDPQVSSSKDKP